MSEPGADCDRGTSVQQHLNRLRQTHTVATLEVSTSAYDEIKKLLEEAGYQHTFIGDMIDMSGIGLVSEEPEVR